MLKIIPVDDAEEPYRAPDLIFDGIAGDITVNAIAHRSAPGDLKAEQGLATQVLICLMTDRRVEASELRDGDTNRGWVGDSFDLENGETDLGSRLWLLRRGRLFEGIETVAESYAREALQPLLRQGAVVRVDATATADRSQNRLDLAVALYGREGAQVYNDTFAILWRQIDGVERPLAG
ncbi:phage GP46 family protein [Pararhizobium sp. O133]|uniref:phage GP46 family protein n=1 Tax=Pararhizobium sp. O133 TaxID=3449278 RepID=UPI003F68250E